MWAARRRLRVPSNADTVLQLTLSRLWCRGLSAAATTSAKPEQTRSRVTRPVPQEAAVANRPPGAATSSSDHLWRLTDADCGKFFRFSEQDATRLLPEGCAALEAEFEASGTREVLVRQSFLRARARLFPGAACTDDKVVWPPTFQSCLVLDGPAGSGKSVLLALLVAAVREAGGVALYVPRGRALTINSLFYQHEGATPPVWDTPGHATKLLSSLWAVHGPALESLPQRRPGCQPGKQLGDLHAAGTAATATPVAAVDAALGMLQELRLVQELPTLIAVDEINALWGWTEYHQTTGPRSRKRLHAGQLRVAEALRAFDAQPGPVRGALLGATSANAGVSPKVHVGSLPKGSRRAVSRFTAEESNTMVRMYASAGCLSGLEDKWEDEELVAKTAIRLHALTVGSGAELRDILPLLG